MDNLETCKEDVVADPGIRLRKECVIRASHSDIDGSLPLFPNVSLNMSTVSYLASRKHSHY